MNIKINIPDDINKLINTLQENEHFAYIMGECVRDSILNRNINNWEICTSATIEDISEIFGTIDSSIKITTCNILEENLYGKDFTINAMAYNEQEGLIDPFDGLYDIKYKKIKCVGNAEDRFNEDGLRILRAISFAAQLGFSVESDTKWQIHQLKDNLYNVPIEKINSEFCKIASTDMFCVELLLYYDVFSLFIPELEYMIDFMQQNPNHIYNSVFSHTIHALDECNSEDLIVRLAVFFHDFGKPHSYIEDINGIKRFYGHGEVGAEIVDEIMRRLKFDNDTRNKVVELVHYHSNFIEVNKMHIKVWLHDIGVEQFERLLEVKKADYKAKKYIYSNEGLNQIRLIENILKEILDNNECFTLKDLAINGDDVKEAMMLTEERKIGHWLNEVLDRVITDELPNNREYLIRWLSGVAGGWIKM